jgi:hypothetical protein
MNMEATLSSRSAELKTSARSRCSGENASMQRIVSQILREILPVDYSSRPRELQAPVTAVTSAVSFLQRCAIRQSGRRGQHQGRRTGDWCSR